MPTWLYTIIFAIGVLIFLGYILRKVSGDKIGLKTAIIVVVILIIIGLIITCHDDGKDGAAFISPTAQELSLT